jgi:serine/threonine protein kinase, bacterial
MTLPANSLLQSRYRLVRTLGSGGMGDVYLAEDTRLPGRLCAVKGMSPAALPAEDRNWAIAAFRQEAQMLATLRHRGLTQVADFFAEGGNWYLVMEYVEGFTLEDYLQRAPGHRIPPSEALSIITQLCDVLDYLHHQNPRVIFRDLKPPNVMLTPQGEVKLIDFGIARFFKPGKTQDTVNLGTPGYAAPEQHGQRGQTDVRSDVYSLGVMLHQMLTGHDPTTTIFNLPPARSVNPAIPPAGEAVINRATQLDPALRFQSVAEFRQALMSATPTPSAQLPLAATVAVTSGSNVQPYGSYPAGTPYIPLTPYPLPAQRRSATGQWIIVGVILLAMMGLALVAIVATRPTSTTIMPTVSGRVAMENPTPTVEVSSSAGVVPSAVPAIAESVSATEVVIVPATDISFLSPTAIPPAATPRPINTPRPTSTPRPTDTPAPACLAVTGPFANLAEQLQSRLGCAQSRASTSGAAEEIFQNGRMYWREDNDQIYVLYKSGRWEVHRDIWNDGDPDYSCGTTETPPTPIRGFGKIWCTFASVRNGLGNATEGERGLTVTVQQFDNGFIVQTDNRTLVFYNDGTWERH